MGATGKVPEVIMMENVKEIQKWGPFSTVYPRAPSSRGTCQKTGGN